MYNIKVIHLTRLLFVTFLFILSFAISPLNTEARFADGSGSEYQFQFPQFETTLVANAFTGFVSNFFENVAEGFRNLSEIAWDSIFPPQDPEPLSPAPPPQELTRVVVTQVEPLDLVSLKSELKVELENYVRSQIALRAPTTIYQSFSTLTATTPQSLGTNEVIPIIYRTITRQSDSDASRTSVNLANITNEGTFTSPTLTDATITGATFPSGLTVSGGGASITGDLTITGNTTVTGTQTHTGLTTFSNGFLSLASSTIGDGTQAGGLTISGDATTTGNAYFAGNVGIGTVSPSYKLDVAGFINTDQYSGYKQAGNTVLYASTTNNTLAVGASSAAGWMSTDATQRYSVAVGPGALATTPTSGDAEYNSAIGYNTLTSNTTGWYNTAVGAEALSLNTTGSNNSALGYQTLISNTTGGFNSTIGYLALQSNTTGQANTAIGAQALLSNTTGTNNSALGLSALYYNTSATNTTAVGYLAAVGTAGYSNQGGVYLGYKSGYSAANGSDYNTFLGYQSGYNVTTGSNNINIGRNVTSLSNTGHAQLNIGNVIYGTGLYSGSAVSSTAVSTSTVGIGTSTPSTLARLTIATSTGSQLALSDQAGVDLWNFRNAGGNLYFATSSPSTFATSTYTSLTINGTTGNVGIGTVSPSYKLDVAGFINTDQYSGYKQAGNTVLYASTTNNTLAVGASSAAGWMSASSTQWYSVAVGPGALATTPTNATAQANSALGYYTLTSNTTGKFNSAVGYQTLFKNTTGSYNSAFGMQALYNNIIGVNNSAFGYGALVNTTGDSNTAVGLSSLGSNTTGSLNTAIGNSAMNRNVSGGNNVAVGGSALYFNTGSNNIGMGYQAGAYITSGSSNIVIGHSPSANVGITTGSNNIVIGQDINALPQGGSNNLDIGNLIFGTNLGTGSTLSTGSVGIGTTSPWGKLSVAGTSLGTNPLFTISTSTASATTTVFHIDSNGLVGIGTAAPAYALDVLASGTGVIARFNSTNATGCTLADGGTITCTSDERMKKNIEDLSLGLETVMDLRPVLFNWNYEADATSKNLGFLAQEVEILIPKLVATDENGMKSLNTTGMIPILVKAVQELAGKISDIFARLAGHDEKITELEARIAELEALAGVTATVMEVVEQPTTEPDPSPDSGPSAEISTTTEEIIVEEEPVVEEIVVEEAVVEEVPVEEVQTE